MISSDSATATRTCTATCAERLPGLAMTSPKFASEAARQPIRSDHSFEFYFNYPVAIYYEGTFEGTFVLSVLTTTTVYVSLERQAKSVSN